MGAELRAALVHIEPPSAQHQSGIPVRPLVERLVEIHTNVIARQHVDAARMFSLEIVGRETAADDELSAPFLRVHGGRPHQEGRHERQ